MRDARDTAAHVSRDNCKSPHIRLAGQSPPRKIYRSQMSSRGSLRFQNMEVWTSRKTETMIYHYREDEAYTILLFYNYIVWKSDAQGTNVLSTMFSLGLQKELVCVPTGSRWARMPATQRLVPVGCFELPAGCSWKNKCNLIVIFSDINSNDHICSTTYHK